MIRHAEWIFQGKGPKEYRDRVMLENLIRLVVHASNEYQRGAAAFAVFIQNYGQKKKTIFRHWNMKKTAL